jgi:hypothetical protein
MDLRMAATASAWASVFSPVSSVSPAISGSANARARASAWYLLGQAVRSAAISSGRRGVRAYARSGFSSGTRFHVRPAGTRPPPPPGRCDHQVGRMAHAGKFDQRARGPRCVMACAVSRDSRSDCAPRISRSAPDAVVQLPQRASPCGGLLRDGSKRHGNGRVVVQRQPAIRQGLDHGRDSPATAPGCAGQSWWTRPTWHRPPAARFKPAGMAPGRCRCAAAPATGWPVPHR